MMKCMVCGYKDDSPLTFCPMCGRYMSPVDNESSDSRRNQSIKEITGNFSNNSNINKQEKKIESTSSNTKNVTKENIHSNATDSTPKASTTNTLPNSKNDGINVQRADNTSKEESTSQDKEVHEKLNVPHKKYNAKKGLRFSIDVLMTLIKIWTIIILISVVLGLISSIILLSSNSTRILGAQFLGYFITFGIYGGLRVYVLYRFANSNYKFSIADVVWTMFVSVPCAILMMVYKGFEEE